MIRRPRRQGATVRWGEEARLNPLERGVRAVRRRAEALLGSPPAVRPDTLPPLPAELRRGPLAATYLEADAARDDRRAGAAAQTASDRALQARAWWPADVWAHRALYHFERAEMELAATRAARRIGDIRVAGGDPGSARRYYAEAISEARDLGAEREEGLAALGLGRAELELGNVATARRLAQIAIDLLERAGGSAEEIGRARELRGIEKEVP